MSTPLDFDLSECMDQVKTAAQQGSMTESAVENIRLWLTENRYADYVPGIIEHIQEKKWKELDDVFWTVIPFGTGGRRGMMYPFGSNAINDRTIGESAKGLADYVKEIKPEGPWSIAIAYDTRHRSREFAELCAGIMVANGFEVFFIDDYRSTPELSFLIRYKSCDCGIMVTASHNPPSDNAVKVYWSTGAQLIPPHDKAVIEKVNQVDSISVTPFQDAVKDAKVHLIREEVDQALRQQHEQQSFDGPRDLKIIFSPLHGVGEFNVKSTLNAVGFDKLEIYEPHREPNGDFPNVPGHVSNPENAEVFESIIEHAQSTGAELILASDPDCDRMGAAAPISTDATGPWKTFNGNQLSVLLGEFVMRKRQQSGTLSDRSFVVSTLVTTRMLRRICQAFDVRCFDENLVGFKWICSVMDQEGPEDFIYGTEESHGFLVGKYCRDKDGAVACMLMSELAAEVKSQGISLFDHLNSLYRTYGYHLERLISIRMEGSDGMKRMKLIMESFRKSIPESMGGLNVVALRDYSNGIRTLTDGTTEPFDGPMGDLVVFETEEEGNYIAARPSGTEPKIKFYMFTYRPADQMQGDNVVQESEKRMTKRLDDFASDLQAIVDHA